MVLRLLLAALCVIGSVAAAQAQSTIDGLPAVPTFPLPDPGLVPQHLWITQGGPDFSITPTQLGYIYQGNCSTLTSPFVNQLCWDTTVTPNVLRAWTGTVWGSPLTGAGGVAVDVKQYGVKDDGSDSTAALTNAVNATAGKACLSFPKPAVGYGIVGPIVLPSGTCFEGVSGGSRIFALANSGDMFETVPNAVVRMTDITLDGSSNAGVTASCFVSNGANGMQGLEFDRDTLINCGNYGVLLHGTSTPSTNIQVRDSFFLNNGTGLGADAMSQFNIENNLFMANGNFGLQCFGGYCRDGTIAGNIFDNSGCRSGLNGGNIVGYLPGNSDTTISNNVTQNACGHGIHWGGTRISYIGNHVMNNGLDGILSQAVLQYVTGSISVTTGSTQVAGLGTSWSGICQDIETGFSAEDGTRLIAGGVNAQIKSVDSNTAMTLSQPWSGPTLANAPYTFWCPVQNTDNTIIGNSVSGINIGGAGIYVGHPVGGSIIGNVIDDATGTYGIVVAGASSGNGLAISGNSIANKADSGIRVDASSTYSAGTVAVTNGSPTVTLSGGNFDNIPTINWFRAAGDGTVYSVTAHTSSSLTIFPSWTGSTNTGLAYFVSGDLSTAISVSGNTTRNNGWGVRLSGCMNCTVSAGTYNQNTIGAILEENTSNDNFISAVLSSNVTISNNDTVAEHKGGQSNTFSVNNLPVTPGGKKTLCIDDTTGQIYKTGGGGC